MITAERVRDRVETVRDRITEAGGDPDRVTVVAVTKDLGRDAVNAALAVGVGDIGESYAQQLFAKADPSGESGEPPSPSLPTAPRWHFVGRLQRNKVRMVAPLVHLWQSVDRAELGQEIAKRAPGAAVLVQVNVTNNPEQGGCAPGDTPALVETLRELGLVVRGLMAVGPLGNPEDARPGFHFVRGLADQLGLPVVSMGMTRDLHVAVQEGSTMVRLGTALFDRLQQ